MKGNVQMKEKIIPVNLALTENELIWLEKHLYYFLEGRKHMRSAVFYMANSIHYQLKQHTASGVNHEIG